MQAQPRHMPSLPVRFQCQPLPCLGIAMQFADMSNHQPSLAPLPPPYGLTLPCPMTCLPPHRPTALPCRCTAA